MNRHSQNSTVQNKTLLLAVCEITKSFKFYHVIKYPPVVLGRCCVQGSHKSYLCYCQMMLVSAYALTNIDLAGGLMNIHNQNPTVQTSPVHLILKQNKPNL